MASEDRPAPAWAGDVGLGVQAWVGQQPAHADPSDRRARAAPPPEDLAATGPDADHEAVARKILLDALTGQARSRKELADKLAKKDVPPELAAHLLDRFEEVGLIDDAAFARMWVEGRQRSRGLAPRALAQELRRKGIADEVAQEALSDVDEASQRAAAEALVAKKVRAMASFDEQKATRRLVGMLARKGYSSGLAFSVVRDALSERAGSGHGDLDVAVSSHNG